MSLVARVVIDEDTVLRPQSCDVALALLNVMLPEDAMQVFTEQRFDCSCHAVPSQIVWVSTSRTGSLRSKSRWRSIVPRHVRRYMIRRRSGFGDAPRSIDLWLYSVRGRSRGGPERRLILLRCGRWAKTADGEVLSKCVSR